MNHHQHLLPKQNNPRFIKTKAIANNILGFIFPPLCIICNEYQSTSSRWLCSSCEANLIAKARTRVACRLCGQNTAHTSCTCDMAWDHPFDKIVSLLDFDDAVKKLMHGIKYQGFHSLAFDLGLLAGNALPAPLYPMPEVIIPVPLHWSRKLMRGYNQAQHIADGLARSLEIRPPVISHALLRVRATKTQTKLDKEKRIDNIAHAFSVAKNAEGLLKNKHILLVDDVVTTGSTTAFCAKTLAKTGPASISVFSLARD